MNLSSRGHRSSPVHLDDANCEPRPYDKFGAYGQSKTANILLTVELDRRGVRSYAVHPGMIATELGRHTTRDDLAELRRRASAGGAYLEDCAVAVPEPWAADADTARALWDLSDRLVGLTG